MTRLLMVPMHLDALCLDHNAYSVAPFVAHDQQPFFDEETSTDVNADRPFLGAALQSPPFSDSLQPLASGVHLHWALPVGLAKAQHKAGQAPDGSDDDAEFPPAPNRWLVVRSESSDGQRWAAAPGSTFWLIESDFISVVKTAPQAVSFATPLSRSNRVPFRYLGRTTGLAVPGADGVGGEWREADASQYLPSLGERLTAVGSGDPSFAAFYPACAGVFGLYDEVPARPHTRYEVFGWYSDAATDPLRAFTAEFDGLSDMQLRQFLNRHVRTAPDGESPSPEPPATPATPTTPMRTAYLQATDPIGAEELNHAFLLLLQERLGWSLEGALAAEPVPLTTRAGAPLQQTLCYSRITLAVTDQRMATPAVGTGAAVAVGQTGAEALAAHLALKLEPANEAARAETEELLLALDLAPMLKGQAVDMGAKFKEARHTRGFRTVASGSRWSIRPAMTAGAMPGAAQTTDTQVEMPKALADALDRLNSLQTELDRIDGEIATLRQQLFSDWIRYLETCYPEFREFAPSAGGSARVSRIMRLMAQEPRSGLPALEAKLRQRGAVRFVRLDNGRWVLEDSRTPGPASPGTPAAPAVDLASRLKSALSAVDTALGQLNTARLARGASTFVLQVGPGARFYEPNDPVVLFAGDNLANPGGRHGHDALDEPGGLLRCQLRDLPGDFRPGQAGFALAQRLMGLLDEVPDPDSRVGFKQQTANPWNPLMLEWAALVESRQDAEPGHDFSAYSADCLVPVQEALLSLNVVKARQTVATSLRPITGRNVLSSHSRDLLMEKIEHHLRTAALAFKRQQAGQEGLQLAGITPEAVAEAVNSTAPGSVLRRLQRALDLIATDRCYLTQSLGGFNQALLMRQATWQVAVNDPLAAVEPEGFDAFRDFAAAVARQFSDPEMPPPARAPAGGPAPAADRRNTALSNRFRSLYTPAAHYPFHPIRQGQMALVGLRIIDSFGQAADWSQVRKTAAASLDSGLPGRFALTPRITQPARLNFRWISADDDAVETNDHPGTTPVCGWFLPNHLDQSLMVYDGGGGLLGGLDADGAWRQAAGHAGGPARPQDILNPGLARLVTWLAVPENLQKLQAEQRLERALDNILPENAGQHPARALLVGRPMALVRARLTLELRDAPAASQSNLDFESRLAGHAASQRSFTQVRFPFVIGDHAQFNDGVVACWEESRTDSSLSARPSLPSIERVVMFQSLDDAATTVSMLVDPRAPVHAFCGVLPSKAIHIPPEQFSDALKALEVNLFVAPLITEPDKTEVPVSGDPGQAWTWIQREQNAWTHVPQQAVLPRNAIRQAFPALADLLWARMQARGWIRPGNDTESAVVLNQTGDRRPSLGSDDLDALADDLARVIEVSTRAIKPVRTHAHFGPRAEIREGWLQLTESFKD